MVARFSNGLAPKIALLCVSLVLLVAIGEVVARVLQARRTAEGLKGVADADELPVIENLYDLVQSNVRAVHRDVYYRTNDRGLRGPTYTRHPAEGTFRILISGDSVTMGSGVREENAYARVLERLLNEKSPEASEHGVRFEVLNLGVSGINADWANTRLVRLGDYYHADLVVYGFTINDIQGPHYEQLLSPEDVESTVEVWQRVQRFRDSPSYLLRELWPRLMTVVEWDAFRGGPGGVIGNESTVWHLNYFGNPPAWNDFAAALSRLATYANERGICGEVFIHTYLTKLDDDHPFAIFYHKVEDEARSLGLSATQSLPTFQGRDPSTLWVSRFDSHPNAEGHALLAQSLYEGLENLPAECWEGRRPKRSSQGRRPGAKGAAALPRTSPAYPGGTTGKARRSIVP